MNEKPNAAPEHGGRPMTLRECMEVEEPNLPDSETRESVEAIMALADEYRECKHHGDSREPRAALRAAVERVIQERDNELARSMTLVNAAVLATERAERAEQEAAALREDAALGRAFREASQTESFEDGVSASLHEEGITRLPEAWMAGRQDFIAEVLATIDTARKP